MEHDGDLGAVGTTAYKNGCRCEGCKEAKRQDWRGYKARQLNPMEDFEGQIEPDQIADLVKGLVLKIRCDTCGEWHEGSEDCPED